MMQRAEPGAHEGVCLLARGKPLWPIIWLVSPVLVLVQEQEQEQEQEPPLMPRPIPLPMPPQMPLLLLLPRPRPMAPLPLTLTTKRATELFFKSASTRMRYLNGSIHFKEDPQNQCYQQSIN
jgi:hypothetical protein